MAFLRRMTNSVAKSRSSVPIVNAWIPIIVNGTTETMPLIWTSLASSGGRVGYMPSTTVTCLSTVLHRTARAWLESWVQEVLIGLGVTGPSNVPPGGLGRAPPLRRGKSILGRDEDQVETGINVLKRGVSLRRKQSKSAGSQKKCPAISAKAESRGLHPVPWVAG